VGESVCDLQDRSFQVSVGREGAVPQWLGMVSVETKVTGDIPYKRYRKQNFFWIADKRPGSASAPMCPQ
jgi:hypothetical protein